jgi:hypothetical protein
VKILKEEINELLEKCDPGEILAGNKSPDKKVNYTYLDFF